MFLNMFEIQPGYLRARQYHDLFRTEWAWIEQNEAQYQLTGAVA